MTLTPHPVIGPLASSLDQLKPAYQAVVVGSGYGGAVAALRLAEAGQSVCVLERGREFRPGDYPDTLLRGLAEIQVQYHGRQHRSPTALFDFRVNPEMNVLVGCGLGGTSLINANVALQPAKHVLADRSAWPGRFVDDVESSTLSDCFKRAKFELDVADKGDPELDDLMKVRSLRGLARAIQGEFKVAPVAVNFKPVWLGDAPKDRVMRGQCVRCGDCVAGCNYAAKNTLIMNYLPRAHNAGARIFTETKVIRVEPCRDDVAWGQGMRWTVHFEYVGSGRNRFTSRPLSVSAKTVVLAAGALGSTEILFRSESARLRLSRRLGQRFSGNGDMLAFAYNGRERVNAIGLGNRSAHGSDAPGACISGSIELPGAPVLIQDGVIPGALSPILSMGFMLAREAGRIDGHTVRRGRRKPSAWHFVEDYLRGGTRATQTLLGMVDDPTEGSLSLGRDGVRVAWPGTAADPRYRAVEALLQQGAAAADGTYVASPFGNITVHPLGGCAMGSTPDTGVVDDTGLVFQPDGRHHHGLYVCDASIIPRRLGVNPLLTITALAERAAPHIIADAPDACG